MNSWVWPFWPLSTWQVVAIAAAIPLVLLGQSMIRTYVARQQLKKALGGALSDFIEHYGAVVLTVPGRGRDLWLSAGHLHLYDKVEGAVIATVPLAEISHFEIIDRTRRAISFRFRLRSGLEIPDVETTATARFASLFQRLVTQDKQILYLPA